MSILAKVVRKILQKIEAKRFARQDQAVAKIAPVDTILRVVDGFESGKKQKSRLCLMAHFDVDGRIAPYVQNYVVELKRQGFDVIIISTSPKFDERDLGFVQKELRYFIHRKNVGLDFGSWKATLDWLPDALQYDELLLNNDSVFGPLFPLSEVFDRFSAMSAPICGMTDTWETYYHLQSYFLLFKKPAFHSQTFKSFWSKVQLSIDKNKIIDNYEVGLSRHFIADEFQLGAYVPFHELREHCLNMGPANFQYFDLFSRQPGNPTIFMWDILISDFRFPFLKTEILKINRKESRGAVYWRNLLVKVSAEQHIADIASFLKRTQWNCRG
ncbi:MAG: hypothetical protein EOP04_01520 [Proteobacteria bacterium]|nr:MAG: hypothetical protein EOP04_01520 [Pseudomonadota bacterium]